MANLLKPPIAPANLLTSLRIIPPITGILDIDLPGSVSSDNSFSGFISSYFKPPKCLSGCPIGRRAEATADPNPRANSLGSIDETPPLLNPLTVLFIVSNN